MKVIAISEECHGLIGLADNLEHAIDFLMDENWLDEETTVPVFNDKTMIWEDVSMVERFGEHWGNTLRGAKNCAELNEAFNECFFFCEGEVYTGED
jgi:hypothetical protein